MIWIYALLDRDGSVIYVGQNSNPDPAKRLRQHVTAAKRGQTNMPILNWIRKHGTPELAILEIADSKAAADEAERRYIAAFRRQGLRLFNVTDGGGGLLGVRRPEHGAAMRGRKNPGVSAALKERWNDAEMRKAHSARMREANPMHNPDVRERLVHPRGMAGKRHSDETRRRISDAQKGRRNGFFGRRHSDATIQKLRGPRAASCYCGTCRKCYGREYMRKRREAAYAHV